MWSGPLLKIRSHMSCLLRYVFLVAGQVQVKPKPRQFKLDDQACPSEKGFCLNPNGKDQNAGVKKIMNIAGVPSFETRQKCLDKCKTVPGVRGCEVIHSQGNAGCYAHTQPVSKGSGHDRHQCWIFKKCGMKAPQFQLNGKSCPSEKGFCLNNPDFS